MARNEDPKPGRWILPIVIIGMIGFTYFFVQTLEASDTTTTTTVSTASTTVPDASSSTAPGTTVTSSAPAEGADAYIEEVTTRQTEADTLAVDLTKANEDWENRATTGVGFTETEQAFTEVLEAAQAFAGSVRSMAGPPAGSTEAATQHANLVAAAGEMEAAAVAALDGLRAPDDGSLRRAAVDDFLAAVDQFVAAGDAAIGAVES
ncbi:MAG TPA: hypothetical protein VIL12_07355 [Acidimicrobiia bacterium]